MRTKVKVFGSVVLSLLLLGLVGCGAKKGSGYDADGDVVGVNDTVRFYGSDVSPADEKELLAKRTYYFGYDGFDVSDEDTLSVYAHAKRLLNGKRVHVRVEGHTDERGSREYNIALGERRANAVANILMLKGVPQDQISVVSYGKEKAAVAGHDESSWSQNRRVVIIYEVE
ncbi:MAG TPA: peptidoglycan-associated lipoprotein Pal [Gammaproteobacteria bacterium]|nr:peptidoglycan-associated lipoprotein Pal [Gammaproteobacteria bacterium]